MPIQPYEPPAASLQALREAAQIAPKAYQYAATMMNDVLADVPAHWPHPVYRIGLSDMATATALQKAELIGWRYLARSGGDRNFAVEVQVDEDEHSFAELDKGPYIDGIYRVLQDKVLAAKIGTTVLRPAVLRLNALGVFAVWLQTEVPDNELIIPLPPTPSYLAPWQEYSRARFQETVRRPAQEKLAQDFSDA
ncbi:MAG TPA: hypothetical protein VFZ34_05055 [Blastocatellia bacterium]|nr:hypothetical protein [Blastocatellia bacterium]